MSKFYKCDVCGKEISYGIGEKARGLIWGEVQQAGPGTKAHINYQNEKDKGYEKDFKDVFYEDVCPCCMGQIVGLVDFIQKRGLESGEMIMFTKGGSK